MDPDGIQPIWIATDTKPSIESDLGETLPGHGKDVMSSYEFPSLPHRKKTQLVHIFH